MNRKIKSFKLSSKESLFIDKVGNYVGENVLNPMPIFIVVPFLEYQINQYKASLFLMAMKDFNTLDLNGFNDIPPGRRKYLIELSTRGELIKRKYLIILQLMLQFIAIGLLFLIW